MASRVASGLLLRRVGATLGLLRSSTHVRSYSSQLSALIPATSQCSNLTRKHCYLPNPSIYQVWSRSFASDNEPGDRVEADEPIAQIETDKVTIDVASSEAGVIEKSAILRMHSNVQRPVVMNGDILARPMMYLADIRPQADRRQRGCLLPAAHQGCGRGPQEVAA